MGRALIIILAGTLSYLTISNINSSTKLNDNLQESVSYFSDTQARNIANSAVQLQLAKIADNTDYRTSKTNKLSLFGGEVKYSVVDTTVDSENYIKINSRASYFGSTKSVSVLVNPVSNPGFHPPALKAAVSTNNPIKTLGTLTVDGREHDKNGNLLTTGGTLGIWTTSSFQRKGSSTIGGTDDDGDDYAPAKKYDEDIVETNQSYSGGYPTTPDSILGGTANGFPPGKLKSIAQSGKNGSQYSTNPATIKTPLKGVTYVELPPGGSWISANITGSGILIVHNSSLDAVIKNLNVGTFKGILIADDIDKIHTDIIGGVIGLSPSPPSGNCIGNGSGNILYSSEAILEATGSAMGGGEPQNYGFGASRLSIKSWYE
ncbi:MAG: hypothetical protein R3250_04695 [Melioribacteraceae bacterium]|nr:hypothetical protein [Melioribacteraceae bacterium]